MGTPDQLPRRPDAGSRAWSARAGWLALAMVVLVAVLQRWPEPPTPTAPPGAAAFVAADPQADLTGRFVLKVAAAMRRLSPGQSVRELTANMDMLARASRKPGDWMRAAIVAAELWRVPGDAASGRNAAESRLAQAERLLSDVARPEDRAALERDLATLRNLYAADGGEAMHATLTPEDAAALLDRYGYYGRVALAYHLPDHASERAALFDGGEVLLVIAAVFFAGAGLAGLAGLVLLVLGAVWAAHGQLRPAFQPPAPGGSVYIETFLIFLVGFVALSAAGEALPDSVKSRAGPALLLSHWLLALVPLWAVLRGTAWREAMFQMGLHRGRGLLRELSAGVGVYVAGLPLVFASVVAALGLVMLMNALMGTPDATPRNPLIDRLARGDPVYLAALFFMATVWAPLVEETIFRGCLYRHLSARWPFAAAGAVSAAAFGVVHGVPLPLTLPLMTLGFIFAFMRHWRGSLAAPIAAHALHNATVLTFALTMLSVLKD